MGLLQTWLGPDTWQRFTSEHRGTQPFAVPSVAMDILAQCDWDHLGQTLAAHAADVLVVRRSEDLADAAPRSLADLHELFSRDAGIVLRNAELVSERVRAFCAAIAVDVPGHQRATVIATPENTHTRAWHFDTEELSGPRSDAGKHPARRRQAGGAARTDPRCSSPPGQGARSRRNGVEHDRFQDAPALASELTPTTGRTAASRSPCSESSAHASRGTRARPPCRRRCSRRTWRANRRGAPRAAKPARCCDTASGG